jgi:exopolyphosphatase/guanosine-5'-triphosphate,3'-diphosphate pyrophosphatase
VREAPNLAAVQAIATRHLGAPLQVVSGRREAELSFAGARLVLPPAAGACRVIDIGGGSTEVAQGDGLGPVRSVSLPLGVNRQGEMITTDPPQPAQVRAIRDEAARMVGGATAGFACEGPLVGVAGTVTTVAAVMAGRYDPDEIHGMVITRDDVARVCDQLAMLDDAARAGVPGLHPDRVGVIVPGLAILGGALDALGADRVMVSERDILDGIAMESVASRGARAE